MELNPNKLPRRKAEDLRERHIEAVRRAGDYPVARTTVVWYPALDELQRGDVIDLAGETYVFWQLEETTVSADGIAAKIALVPFAFVADNLAKV